MARALHQDQSRRVLIFGINYWPERLGIAPYTTGLAEHLAASGLGVTVVTGFPHYPEWKVGRADRFRRTSVESRHGVTIVRRRHFVPGAPTAVRRGLYELSFLAHGLGSLVSERPDVIIGISPGVSGGALAAAASSRFGVPYGIWFQDLSGRAASQSGIPGGNRVAELADGVEAFVARRAAAIAVISGGFRPHLIEGGVEAKRIRIVRNWNHITKPAFNRIEARSRLGLPGNAYICLHAGNMGQKQGLENIIDAARLCLAWPDSPLFILQGDGNCRGVLEERAAGLGNVRFLPPRPDSDFPNSLAAADVLLVNQKPAITDMCLPGKLTSYFASGRPVIAAVHADSETANELRLASTGLIVPAGEPQCLVDAIRQLRSNPGLGLTLAQNALHFAETELSPAAAFASIDAFVDQIAADRTQKLVQSVAIPVEGD